MPGPTREPISLSNQPSMLPLAGQHYLVAKHTLGERDLLEQYARDRIPQPLAELHARAKQFDESMYQEIVRAGLPAALLAQDRWPPRFGSPDFYDVFKTAEGSVYLLWVALRRSRPDLALDAVQAIAEAADRDLAVGAEMARIFTRFLLGIDVQVTAEDLTGPKAPAGEAPPAGGTPSATGG